MNEQNLGTEKISKLFFTVVIPSTFAMVILGIQGLIDGLFIGRYVGNDAMASVNIALPYSQSLSAVAMVISIGCMAYIGRSLGANEEQTAKTVFKTSFIALLVSSFVFLALSQIFGENIAKTLGASDILLKETVLYLKIIALFLPFLFIYYLTALINRVIGSPHLFAISTIISIIINILLNYLFIVVMQKGVLGSAIATGISHFIGFAINIYPVLLKKTVVNIYEGEFNFKTLCKVCYNGSSEGVTSVSTAVTTWVFNLTFMKYYGENGVTAFSIIGYISQVATLLIFGLADGISPIVSYNFGAGLTKRVRQTLKIAIISSVFLGICIYILVFSYGESLISIFADNNTELITLTYNGAKLYGLMFFICGINILASSYFTAIGDAFKSIIVSSSRGLIFILIGILVLPKIFDVTGVWLVSPFADFITLIIVLSMTFKSIKN